MNFNFGKRVEQVDWRKLAAVDLDRLTREMDVKTLQENIMNITYCNIEAELGVHAVGFDPNFIKLFNLAQLIIEYLLHSQEYLSSNLETEVKKVQEAMQSAEEVRKELEQKSESQSKLKRENKRLKKWIAEYQLMMRAGSSGIHKCPYCAKAFVSQEYLSAHLSRRHNGDSTHMNGFITISKPVDVSPKGVTNGEVDLDKLALLDEMKQIKERLYATERDLINERTAREMNSAREKDQVLTDQSKLKGMEDNYERWRTQEDDKHQREMDYLKDSLMQQVQELKVQNQEEKRTFSQAISDLKNDMNKRPSMIGSIKDEDEPDGIPTGPSKDEIANMMKEQFDQMKQQSQEERQREMKKMNQKWKVKEEKLEMDHRNEMNRLHELLAQYEDKVKNDELEREKLKKLMKKRDKQVEEKKIIAEQFQQAEQQQQDFATPPPKREVTFSDELLNRERVKTPDFKDSQDYLTLYVAANLNRSQYRLWRQRSEGSSEWVDKFFFHAYIKPIGPFTTPIYIHSASGSPYWRQCITGSSTPPSNEYHLDYMFYASQNPVLGAIQLHVLDAGSLPVLRSCVYKTKELPGWKYKRLSFYVMKSNQTVGTLSSSWDGDQESEESESELEEIEKVNEVMRESMESTADSKDLTSGLSSSEWGTETLQRGEFHPFPNNPSITTQYDHTHEEVMACRQEIEQMLEQKLIKQGVQPSIGRLSSEKLEARMQALAVERQARSKKMRNFDELRSGASQELEDMVKKNYKKIKLDAEQQLDPRQGGKSPVARTKPPTMRAAATAVRTSASLQQQQSLKASTRSSATLSSTDSQDTGPLTTGEQSFSGTSVTERTLSESDNEEDYSDSEEISEWDSTGGHSPMGAPSSSRAQPHPFPTNPKVSVRIPTQEVDSDPEEIQPAATRSPYRQQKDNIRERANILERSLGASGGGKKPVGGVALPGKQDDDFDDDSDLSLSSVEEKTKPTQITRAEMNRTGPRTESTPVPAPRTRPLPSPRRDVSKPSTSAVQAFSIDDYSDFDDSDLEMHHL